MRVLHLIHAFNRGGIEKWLLNMIAAIPRDSCQLDVCCKGSEFGPWSPIATQHGAQMYLCPLRPSQVGYVRGLRRILTENHYDLVHNHLGVYSGLAVWAAKKVGTPIITTFHSSDLAVASPILSLPVLSQLRSLYGRYSVRYAIKHSDLITAVSAGVLDDMVPPGSPLRHKCAVLYLGAEIPEVATDQERASFRQSMGWNADTPVVIHVGRFFEQKNHVGILTVFERVLRQLPEVKLILVGEGPLADRVRSRIRAKGLGDAIRLLGPRNDAASLIARSDVLLFPSLFEGFGIVALEANAAGIPVVGSNVVGLNEAVENGTTAILWDVDDVESMASSVVRILSDREYGKTMGQAGRRRAEQRFSTEASAARLMRLYSGLLDREKGGQLGECTQTM